MTSYPERFASHWWYRPGVCPDTRLLVWHVLFDQHPQVRAIATSYQERLAESPGLGCVALEWLHMTLHIAATSEDTTEEAIRQMADAVAGRLTNLPPVEVVLSKPLVHKEGVLLIAEMTPELMGLHAEVVAGVAEVLGGGHPSNEAAFIPHVSLAYANAPTPTAPAFRALKPRLPPCRFTISDVQLVKQRRDHCSYQWETLAVATLGK